MPNLIKDLKIFDVSTVDKGAGVGVRILLAKRDGTQEATDVETIAKMSEAELTAAHIASREQQQCDIAKSEQEAVAKVASRSKARAEAGDGATPKAEHDQGGTSLDSIAAALMSEDKKLSRKEARAKAEKSPEFRILLEADKRRQGIAT